MIEVVAAIIKIENKFLCCQRDLNKYNYLSKKFEFPGGKVDWKNFFESNKSRVTRHHQKAKEIGLPGIPYWRNSGTGSILYISEDDIAYGMCGPDFICSKELNEKKVFISCLFMEVLKELKATSYMLLVDFGAIAMISSILGNVDQVVG